MKHGGPVCMWCLELGTKGEVVRQQELDLDFFIQKFASIPSEYLGLSTDPDPTDAWEWCSEEEQRALHKIIRPFGIMLLVNDGDEDYIGWGATPHARVTYFLNHVKETKMF